MRLHRVAAQAFGPFASRVEVDVDSLAEQGLFLLHGQTGAGKTSLLDAVCFALYGSVPGARSSTGRLRSDHAAEGVAPSVECEFSIGSRRFEVVRSPAWSRPKARGQGRTTENAKVMVRELVAGQWIPLATRLDEAGLLLCSLLGMDREQFTQVILLPQGDFAAFLRSGADDRQKLLEKLFGTQRFTAVEGWLAERRTSTQRALREAEASRDHLLARVDERSGALHDPTRDFQVLDSAAQAEERHLLAVQLLEREREGLATLHAGALVAQDQADSAAERHRGASALVDALEEQRSVQGCSEEMEVAQARLLRGRDAAQLDAHRQHLQNAATALEEAERAHSHALQVVAATLPGPDDGAGLQDLAGADAAALSPLVSSRRRKLGTLADLLPTEGEQLARAAEHDRLCDRVVVLEAELADLNRQNSAAAGRASLLATRSARLTAAALLLDPARAAAERARLIDAAAAQVGPLQEECHVADAQVSEAVDRSQGAQQEHLDLLQLRLEGMAAELANGLVADDPCPVCGACEHPVPALASGFLVDAATVARARFLAAEQAREVEAARSRAAAVRQRLGAAQHAGEGLTVQEAAERVVGTQHALTEAERAVIDLRRVTEQIGELEVVLTGGLSRASSLTLLLDSARGEAAQVATLLEDAQVRLARARGDDLTVAGRHARLLAQVQALEILTEAVRILAPAAKAASAARRAAQKAAVAAGFDSLADALEAAIAPALALQLSQRVAQHARRQAGVAARLATPELRQAAEEHPVGQPDLTATALLLTAARRVAAEQQEQVRAATGRVTVLEGTAVALHALTQQLAEHESATRPLREQADVVTELAACAVGTSPSNVKKMRLSAFVLAARLEQVAVAATQRLRTMSEGRYELVHCDERKKGAGRSGLGLKVVDHWTGQDRDTASLSGGESFVASLALALGLADVVQAEAGGASIDTLFVDEGFGTLDEDTLEQVMTCLDQLREGGRAVGLVSHVPELRARIPSQLHVVRGRAGSTVQQISAVMAS